MYSYSDLNSYIHKYMYQQTHKTGENNLSFALSTYRIVTEIDSDYQLDLRDSEFDDFKIGFDKKILNKTEYGSRLPNTYITNSIDMIHINADAITNSVSDGVNTNTICTCEQKVCIFWQLMNGISQKHNVLFVEKIFD